jgi:hypothetical protein
MLPISDRGLDHQKGRPAKWEPRCKPHLVKHPRSKISPEIRPDTLIAA